MSAPDVADAGYVHATALVIREAGVLLRGPSGSGKTSLAALLIWAAQGEGQFARLVGDDRVALQVRNGAIVARAHPAIAGWMERRTHGIVSVPFEPACVLALLIDLAQGVDRLPAATEAFGMLLGVRLPRLAIAYPPTALAPKLILEKLHSGL